MEFPYIDPVLLPIYGEIGIRWYALTYLVGLLSAWWLGVKRSRLPGSVWTEEQISDFVFYGFLGVVIGGRLGYVFFYQFDQFLKTPSILIYIWKGGMSFHGGFLGVLASFWYFTRKYKKSFFTLADFIAPFAPIGLGAGRLGNFINGELWGREVVDKTFSFGMRFSCDLEKAPWYTQCDRLNLVRHPSQLYEFVLEGVVLFVFLYWFSRKPRPRMAVSGLFSLGYGSFRFFVEYFREPDEHLKHMAEWLTMGQVLSVPMIILGLVLLVLAYKNPVFDIAEETSHSNKKNKSKQRKAKTN